MATKMHSLFTTGDDDDDVRREVILDWLAAHIDQVLLDLGLVPVQDWDAARLRALQTEAHRTVDRAIQQLDRAIAQAAHDSPQLDALRQRRHTLARWPGLPDSELVIGADVSCDRLAILDGQIIGLIDLYAEFTDEGPHVTFANSDKLVWTDITLDLDNLPWSLDPLADVLPEWNVSVSDDDASFIIVPSVTHQRDLRARLAALQQAHVYNLVLVSDREDAQATRALAASMGIHFYQIDC